MIKCAHTFLLATAFLLPLCPIPSSAQSPALINYQGRLVDGTNLVNGTIGLTLRFFDAPSGGTLLYADSNAVPVVDGLYATHIGDDTIFGDFDASLIYTQVWLEVEVDGSPLAPRERLVSVPYARQAHGFSLRPFNNVLIGTPTAGNMITGALNAAIGGGQQNVISGTHFGATIGGGVQNRINSTSLGVDNHATIAGGQANRIEFSDKATISGGGSNLINFSSRSAIGGGFSNLINQAQASAIGGGENNLIHGSSYAVIGGGTLNAISNLAPNAVIAGGAQNFIASGSTNSAIGGGQDNRIAANSRNAVIAGGQSNRIASGTFGAVVSGGRANEAQATYATVGGGNQNVVAGSSAFQSTIGGGNQNRIEGVANNAVIAGGQGNLQRGGAAVIGGGENNLIETSSFHTVIGGGFLNIVQFNSQYGVIAGGVGNRIGSNTLGAAIGGGENNTIANGASYSFAAGRRAKVNHPGSFVWAGQADADFGTPFANSFLVRADFVGMGRTNRITAQEILGVHSPTTNDFGGMYISTAGAATRPFYGYSLAGGIAGFHYVDGQDANRWKLNLGGGVRMTVTTGGEVIATTFTPTSDRAAKENIRPVSGDEILQKLVSLPISTWTFKESPDVTHIGPMAQDFHAAFGFGATDKGISTVDADGVALAAIQALARENEELRKQNMEVRNELEAIKRHLGL